MSSSPPPELKFRPRSLTPMVNFSRRTHDTIGMSEIFQNAYVMPKSQVIQLYPSTAPINSKDSETGTKLALLHRISELEKQHRQDKARIENLEKMIGELNMKLEEMKRANKSMLEEGGFGAGGVHILYQDLFMTDLKQQMSEKTQEAAKFRYQQAETRLELELLKKDNFQYQATLKRYRSLLAEAIKKPINTDISDSSFCSAIESETSSHKPGSSTNRRNKHLLDQELKHSSPVGLRSNLLSLAKLEKLNQLLLAINKTTNIVDICKTMSKGVKTLTKSQKLTIYLISQKMKDDYIKSFTKTPDFIGRARVGNE